MRRLDHERAKLVAELVAEVPTGSSLEKYTSLAKRAGAMLRACGLLQSAAFFAAKKPDAEERRYLGHLVRCLSDNRARTRMICAASDSRAAIQGSEGSTITALLQRTSPELALLEEEAGALAGWIKRLAGGRLEDEASPQDETVNPEEE